MRILFFLLLWLSISLLSAQGQTAMNIPDDFPRFQVPGYEKTMQSLRELHWLHYPGAGPKATLWDEWLSAPGLWPATFHVNLSNVMREQWSRVLSERIMDPEGYVATHQHASIAHQLGWPFPFWNQGQGGYGWHFSFKDTVGPPWRTDRLSTRAGWTLTGAEDAGIGEEGWSLKLTASNAALTAPARTIDSFQSPFIQLRWRAVGLGSGQPYLEWRTKGQPAFSPEQRIYFAPVESASTMHYTMIPCYRHPRWKGQEIAQLRIGFGNPQPGAQVVVQALFTQYDTRHNINSQNFVRGCATYFWWTRDLEFLRRNINRMRLALRYVMTEHQALERKVVFTDWVGHDGRAGIQRNPDDSKRLLYGVGIGNNYWDLLPFGHLDSYATIHYYDALRYMAQIEEEIAAHPEWDVPRGVLSFTPQFLRRHAAEVKAAGNRMFWNAKTGRFTAGVDADGKMHDYGFTFVNCEAIAYDFATPAHARSILQWLSGERIVEGDTAKGADIYHWRFAPRATTRRNLEYYGWFWSAPEAIPWGGQVQDGGAVLGFSYHDLMARLKVRGPDDAWRRLQEIVRWFDEVQAAGGYRAYYNGQREGTLQGGGTAGGLGLDQEFFESVLVPQTMLRGFLGFEPAADGFRLNPQLPQEWTSLAIDRIRWQNLILTIRADRQSIEVRKEGVSEKPCFIAPPSGAWRVILLLPDGTTRRVDAVQRRARDRALRIEWQEAAGVRLEREKP